MLSSKTLERVSQSYRQGYNDGANAQAMNVPATGIEKINDDTVGGIIKPFADFDYREGFKAGANDKYWELKRGF